AAGRSDRSPAGPGSARPTGAVTRSVSTMAKTPSARVSSLALLMKPISRSGMEAHLLGGLLGGLQGAGERVPLLRAGREAVELAVVRVHQNRQRVAGLGE